VAALTAAAAVVVSGCGASRTIGSVVDPVARAAQVTAKAPGYRLTGTVQVSSGTVTSQGTMTGTIDTTDHTGVMTSTVTADGRTAQVAEKFDGTTVYMRSSAIQGLQSVTGGKPWVEIEYSKAMGAMGLGSLQTSGSDPAQFVDYLRAVGAHETRVGTATVGGVSTTHYRVTVDLDHYAQVVPAAQRASARQGVATLESMLGSHTLPMDVWIDAHQMVRRVAFSLTECVENQHLHMSMAMNLSDYGQQTIPQMPAASQTYDLTPVLTAALKKVKLACTGTV